MAYATLISSDTLVCIKWTLRECDYMIWELSVKRGQEVCWVKVAKGTDKSGKICMRIKSDTGSLLAK